MKALIVYVGFVVAGAAILRWLAGAARTVTVVVPVTDELALSCTVSVCVPAVKKTAAKSCVLLSLDVNV